MQSTHDHSSAGSATTNLQQQTQTCANDPRKIKGPPQPFGAERGGDPDGDNTVTGRYPASVYIVALPLTNLHHLNRTLASDMPRLIQPATHDSCMSGLCVSEIVNMFRNVGECDPLPTIRACPKHPVIPLNHKPRRANRLR